MARKCQFEHCALVLQTLGSPEFLRISEKFHRRSKSFIIATCRTPAICDSFAQKCLPTFIFADAVLVGFDHGGAVSIHDAVEKLFDLAINLRQLGGHRLLLLSGRCKALIPEIAEDFRGNRDQIFRRRKPLEQLFKFAFNLCPSDGRPSACAALRAAEVISVVTVAPL